MSVQDAIQRGNNLLGTAIVGLAGFAFFPEIFIEDKIEYKIDDIALFIIGIISIIWYRKSANRFSRSLFPAILVIVALVIKLFAIFIEFKEKDDVGDDFGGMILFLLSAILVLYLYNRKTNGEKSK